MTASGEPLIGVEDLHFSYNPESAHPIHALRGICLEIHRGDYLVIIGHNGSGKSTLAKHFNALLHPTRGRVFVKGLDTSDRANTRAIRSSVGMVFQVPDNQIVATVVEEDIAFGPENLGIPEAELQERVEWALRVVGLEPFRHRAPHRLSAGQKQLVAIAGVIAMKPQVLMLDEATAMLDPEGRRDVLAAVRALHSQGVSIVAITHDMHEATAGGRVVVMDGGRIVLDGSPQQVFSQVETLRDLQLDVPQTADLAHQLHERDRTFPPVLLSVGEMVDQVQLRKRAPASPTLGTRESPAEPNSTGPAEPAPVSPAEP